MAVGIDDAVKGFDGFVLARMVAVFVPGEAAVVAADAKFPEDEAGLALKMLDDAGDSLTGAVHAFRAKFFRRAGVVVTAVFMPGLEIGIGVAGEIAAGGGDGNLGAGFVDPGEGILQELLGLGGFAGFVVGFPEADAGVVFVGVDDVLDVGLQFVAILRVMTADIFAGGNDPAAVVDAGKGRGILVVRRKDIFVRLVPAIVEEDEFGFDAVFVGARQKILDVGEQGVLLFQVDGVMQINADAIDAVDGGVMEFAVVDGGIVLVPLLGFVDVFGGDENGALHPTPIGVIGHRGGWRDVSGIERRRENEKNRNDNDAEDDATISRRVQGIHDYSDAGSLAGGGFLSNAGWACANGNGNEILTQGRKDAEAQRQAGPASKNEQEGNKLNNKEAKEQRLMATEQAKSAPDNAEEENGRKERREHKVDGGKAVQAMI
jgi:hypothetical protein